MGNRSILVNLTVLTDDQSQAVRAHEVLSRAAVGLALEGITVSTNVTTVDDEDDGSP